METVPEIREIFMTDTFLALDPLQGIGVLFDIDALGGGVYSARAWELYMKYLDPALLCPSILLHGDTNETLNGEERIFCIAAYSSSGKVLEYIRAIFEGLEENVFARDRFIYTPRLLGHDLSTAGNLDATASIVMDNWDIDWHQRCLKYNWGYAPGCLTVSLPDKYCTELESLRPNVSRLDGRGDPQYLDINSNSSKQARGDLYSAMNRIASGFSLKLFLNRDDKFGRIWDIADDTALSGDVNEAIVLLREMLDSYRFSEETAWLRGETLRRLANLLEMDGRIPSAEQTRSEVFTTNGRAKNELMDTLQTLAEMDNGRFLWSLGDTVRATDVWQKLMPRLDSLSPLMLNKRESLKGIAQKNFTGDAYLSRCWIEGLLAAVRLYSFQGNVEKSLQLASYAKSIADYTGYADLSLQSLLVQADILRINNDELKAFELWKSAIDTIASEDDIMKKLRVLLHSSGRFTYSEIRGRGHDAKQYLVQLFSEDIGCDNFLEGVCDLFSKIKDPILRIAGMSFIAGVTIELGLLARI